jgi:two-component system response regulator AtoC
MRRLPHPRRACNGSAERPAGPAAFTLRRARSDTASVAARILIIDTDPAAWAETQRALEATGCAVLRAESAPTALAALTAQRFDLVLCDRRMPFREGSALAAELTRRLPDGRCVMTSDEPAESLAAEAIASGWSEVLTRPSPPAAVLLALRRARERTRLRRRLELAAEDLARAAGDRPIVAASPAMIELLEQIERLAGRRGALLIAGEPGCGREGIARAIHAQSPRRSGPFVVVDCARGSEREREHRLFGTRSETVSAIRDAAGGTLYLDAIDALPVALQLRLAAALHAAESPGAPERAELHAIAATSADLDELVRRGAFWKELYELLRAVRVRVPALRERREDIPLLVDHLLAQAAAERGRDSLTISGDALDLLIGYRWPGNVRELAAVLARAADRAPDDVISARELPEDLSRGPGSSNPLALRSARRAFEADLIRRALRATAGNRTRAARLLEISHRALLYKLKELEIND